MKEAFHSERESRRSVQYRLPLRFVLITLLAIAIEATVAAEKPQEETATIDPVTTLTLKWMLEPTEDPDSMEQVGIEA